MAGDAADTANLVDRAADGAEDHLDDLAVVGSGGVKRLQKFEVGWPAVALELTAIVAVDSLGHAPPVHPVLWL